jgi:pyridoxine kinase
MNLLSIQSHVAYGHVGNSAAVFPLQRLGVEVWPVNTVQFSNHTGYGKWRGEVFGAAEIREVIEGIADRGVLKTCDGVISGYLGTAEIGEVVLEAVAKVKVANKRALYCCDPVIGDGGKAYVQGGITEFFRDRALATADVLTPNQFELETLSGIKVRSMADAAKACDALHA